MSPYVFPSFFQNSFISTSGSLPAWGPSVAASLLSARDNVKFFAWWTFSVTPEVRREGPN